MATAPIEPEDAPQQVSTASFVNIGERTNVTGSARFKKLVMAGDYTASRSRASRSRMARR
jgi:5-methyltetrahydrofolate--homocysteine methyltransferase